MHGSYTSPITHARNITGASMSKPNISELNGKFSLIYEVLYVVYPLVHVYADCIQ